MFHMFNRRITMNKILTMAAMALMISACSSNDLEETVQQPNNKAEGIPFTATIRVGESATTRALTEDGATIVPSWAEGDKVALIHGSINDEMTVSSVSDGVATITGNITGSPADGDAVTIIYPSSAADGATGNVKADLLTNQDGTLATIADKYDVRKGTAKLNVGTTATLQGNVSLDNLYAIVKFSLSDGTNAINASKFQIKDGSDNLITTVTPASATSTLYVAMAPATASAFKFEATVGSSTYSYTKSSATFAAGKYYQSKMAFKTKVNVTSIKLSQTKLDNYIIDDPVTLVATVGPDDATDKTVVWESNNPTFASVSATGEVSFNYQGTAKITATATNGTPDDPSDDVSATCEVTVSIKYITMTTTVDSKDFTDREMWKADTKFAIAYFIDDVIRKPAEATVQSISGTVATLSAQVDSRIVNNSTASIIYPYDAADTAPGDILPGALRDQDGVNTPLLWTAKVSKGASSVSLTDMAVGNYVCVLFKPEVDGVDVILKLTSLEIYKGETDDKSKLTTVTYTPPTDTKSLIYVTLPLVKLGRIEGTDVDGKKYEIDNLDTTLIKGKKYVFQLNMIEK